MKDTTLETNQQRNDFAEKLRFYYQTYM